MIDTSAWDWDPGTRTIAEFSRCDSEIEWREESQASPDGEKVAA